MASTFFINNTTVILADWLNDVNAATYLSSGVALDADSIQAEFTNKVPRSSTTGSASLPAGTSAERDLVPIDGMIRYNSELLQFEGYFNGLWQSVGGGQLLGNAATKGVFYNSKFITEDLVVSTGTNAGSFGPITINDGFSVTVADGSVWSIV